MSAPTLDGVVAGVRAAVAGSRPESDVLAPGSIWNLSQTLQHCAQTIEYSLTGYPRLKPALYRRTVGVLAKRVFLARGAMRHPLGAEIDGAPPLDPDQPLAAALDRLAAAVAAFGARTTPPAPHPAYGACTLDEMRALHGMHLAEHLPGVPA